MRELRELVGKYMAGEIDFPGFRRAMVVGFLSSRNLETATESVATAIEVDCSDFSEGLIVEDQLKRNLVLRLQPGQTTNVASAIVFLLNYDCPVTVANSESPNTTSGTFSGLSAQSAASAQLVHAA